LATAAPVPQEAPPQDTQQDQPQQNYGPNNEKLPQELISALLRISERISEEDRYARRVEVQEAKRQRLYWRGLQHLVWDYKNEGWQILGPNGANIPGSKAEDSEVILYVTNIYQAFGLSIQSVLTQNRPSVRAEPQDPNDPADVSTARAGNRYKKIIEHLNCMEPLQAQNSYYAWTDGRIGAWTRWGKNPRTGQEQELISMVGTLELKVPITVQSISDYPYVQYSDEFHIRTIQSEVAELGFPEGYQKKIKAGAMGGGEAAFERFARVSVRQGTNLVGQAAASIAHLVTRQRTWISPAWFEDESVEDGISQQLKELFPNGCQVRFDNSVYTGAWAESIGDRWSIMHPLPGDGQFRPSMGSCLVSVQDRFNDIANATQDIYERTLPASYWDDKMFDVDGMKEHQSRPGARYGVTRDDKTQPIPAGVFFEPPAAVSPDMLEYGKDLMGPTSQFLTGAFPALFGGNMAGSKTAAEYSMARDQALGRIGIVWRAMKSFYSEIMEQAIKVSAENRKDDLSIAIPDNSGTIENEQVRLEELKGNVHWYPDTDENFPESWTQKREAFFQLLPMAAQNLMLAQILDEPNNLELGRRLIGLEDFVIPGADAERKQLAEINELLKSAPVPGTPDQITGQMGPDQPSIPIDPIFDDNAAEFETGKRWMNSAEAQKKKQDPELALGVANVKAHLMQHHQAMAAQAPPPMPPMTKGGAPPPPAPTLAPAATQPPLPGSI